ncbi:low-density lipoprotein receptor domain-containing jelly belly protein [Lycorma delicatula]|uniref:low-density lipoprotein receptor domain-containing jelly belly protein n=1 Tax=Lycorma delicatula TaxID=130591 RepID=UPI003F517D72
MAASTGGLLLIGAGITLLVALLRLSDGSLLVARPQRLNEEEEDRWSQQPTWRKRTGGGPELPKGLATQFLTRSPRGNRQFDVPQIECPTAEEDGMERFACPTPDRMGRYRCIDDHVLCDGFIDCPSGEDEDRQACMFYKTTKAHLDILADALLRWARGR